MLVSTRQTSAESHQKKIFATCVTTILYIPFVKVKEVPSFCSFLCSVSRVDTVRSAVTYRGNERLFYISLFTITAYSDLVIGGKCNHKVRYQFYITKLCKITLYSILSYFSKQYTDGKL